MVRLCSDFYYFFIRAFNMARALLYSHIIGYVFGQAQSVNNFVMRLGYCWEQIILILAYITLPSNPYIFISALTYIAISYLPLIGPI